MPKKEDRLTALLEQFKQNDMTASEMAQTLRGLVKLEPGVLKLVSDESSKKGRSKNDPTETTSSTF